jgi:hypothetical protein
MRQQEVGLYIRIRTTDGKQFPNLGSPRVAPYGFLTEVVTAFAHPNRVRRRCLRLAFNFCHRCLSRLFSGVGHRTD